MPGLQGKRTVVVTGSSSGIGAAIAARFAEPGTSVLLHGKSNLSGLFETSRRLRPNAESLRCIVHDIAFPRGLKGLVEAAFALTGRVDVWINAAGADVLTGSARLATFEEKLELLWKTDAKSTILLSRLVADRMQAQEEIPGHLPSIINIGWDQAEGGMEGDSGQFFCPIKGAIMSFTRSLAKSIGPKIRANCVAPGWIKTAWGEQAPTEWDRRAKQESCLERWGRPEDIAETCYFLASPASEFINGQTIAVNGGWRSRPNASLLDEKKTNLEKG